LRKLHLICSYLIAALGVVHILYTTQAYERFTLNAFWFIGSGMGILFAGFLNLMYLRLPENDRVGWILCLLGNLIALILFIVGWFLIGEPQVLVGILLFACTTAATFSKLFSNGPRSHTAV
jgi:uncharacterized BrkB/YihY/UPF0761 family membrane protein